MGFNSGFKGLTDTSRKNRDTFQLSSQGKLIKYLSEHNKSATDVEKEKRDDALQNN